MLWIHGLEGAFLQQRIFPQVEAATGCQNLCVQLGGEGEQFFCHRKIDGQGIAFKREGKNALTFAHAFEYVEERCAPASGNKLEYLRKILLPVVLGNDELVLDKAAFSVALIPVIDGIER